MKNEKKSQGEDSDTVIEKTRLNFKSLLISNPNYFGNLPESKFKLIKKISSNTNYEALTRVGYNPQQKQLFATLDIKRSIGYNGNLCASGSTEYVRFYVDHGTGWNDVGVSATSVHDISAKNDCANKKSHPLSYSVELSYSPFRRWCTTPQLPKVRAILSWDFEPPENQPEWQPVYGDTKDCNIQIDKGFQWPFLIDAFKEVVDLPVELDKSIPDLSQLSNVSDTLPAPVKLSLDQLIDEYTYPASKDNGGTKLFVEPNRFMFPAYQFIKSSSDASPNLLQALNESISKIDIDINDLVGIIEDTKGDVSYEELEDVGLDYHRNKLVATYRVKKTAGYSGGLCSSGSHEYVSFWADWNDKCEWEYLDTVKVNAYDFSVLPDGGLCYTAALPVNLDQVRQHCNEPLIGRVRAVLSWNSPPSKIDPDAIPHWGNRLDAHVLVPPGAIITELTPIMTVVGGVGIAHIGNDGLTLSGVGTKFADTGFSVDNHGRACPFGGRIVIRGVNFPGHRYRVQVRDIGTAVWTTLTQKIWITPVVGFGQYHYIDNDGWFQYKSFNENHIGVLGYFDTSGDSKWEIRLQIEGVSVADTKVVQLDNTHPKVAISITNPVGDCGLVTQGTSLEGNVTATDAYMGSWRVEIDGGPAGFGPIATGTNGIDNTPIGGATWHYEVNDPQCGYIVRVVARDRAIINSTQRGQHSTVDVGYCVLDT